MIYFWWIFGLNGVGLVNQCIRYFPEWQRNTSSVRFARVNVDNAQDIAMRYGVQSIPTFIMFKNGEIANRMVGAVGEPGIHMICKKFVDNQ